MKFFVFGSTGDLVKRKIVPALSRINIPDLEIIALGRKDLEDNTYHSFVCENGQCFDNFNKKPEYTKISIDKEVICEECIKKIDKENINFFYSAMPPQNIEQIINYIGKLKNEGYKVKLLIEKPFGENLESALLLEKRIIENDLTEDVFISDHYVFKDEILNLDKKDFNKIKIVSLEEVGLENRISYYDNVGALKDMVQNHFFNIIFKIITNPEREFENFDIIKFTRGQYGDGENTGYVKELGKGSETETFVKLILNTDNKEFEFITGKKFSKKETFIEIDNNKIVIDNSKNSYEKLLSDFLKNNLKNFPTIKNSILAWQIIDKIEKNKPQLIFYKEKTNIEDVQ
jgi:glucose-6-phosphate 1-dehydrogenase